MRLFFIADLGQDVITSDLQFFTPISLTWQQATIRKYSILMQICLCIFNSVERLINVLYVGQFLMLL